MFHSNKMFIFDCFGLILCFVVSTKGAAPPYFIEQPLNNETIYFQENQSNVTVLKCYAEGDSPPSYYWHKDGRLFDWRKHDKRIDQEPGRGSLLILNPLNSDEGQYQCFAANELGVATSNSVFLRRAKISADDVTLSVNVTGIEGEPFHLTCPLPEDNIPKPDVNWMAIDKEYGFYTSPGYERITIGPQGSLWFSNLTMEESDKMFACSLRWPDNRGFQWVQRVKINVKPFLAFDTEPVLQYVSPSNLVGIRGRSVKLFCIFGGTPVPNIIWKKDGKRLRSSHGGEISNLGRILLIRNVKISFGGLYTCEVSNGVGAIKNHSIFLKVESPPYFIKEPQNIDVKEGEDIEIECLAQGVPPVQYNWIHNGKPLEEEPTNINKLTLKNVRRKDTGNFGCNASNILGYVYKDVYVNVGSYPSFIEYPKSTVASVGQNIKLTCDIVGRPTPEITWTKDGGGKTITGPRFFALNNNIFIQNVTIDDEGEYTCVGDNRFGRTSAIIKLTVTAEVVIKEGPQDVEQVSGKSATFDCIVKTADVDVTVTWLKDYQPINFDESPRYVQISNNSLTIANVNEIDSGTYTCLAKVDTYETTSSASLIVQDVPNPPAITRFGCQDNQVEIFWHPLGDNRSPILYYIIQYSVKTNLNTWEDMIIGISPIDWKYKIDLAKENSYAFRVIAVNKIGRSAPSAPSEYCMIANIY